MECILHIGCEKTGTTSIQVMLAAQSDALAKKGILAVRSAGFPNATGLALASLSPDSDDHGFARLGVRTPGAREKWSASLWKSIASEARSTRPSAERIILSSEHLQSRLTSASEIADLQSRLAGIGVSKVRVVVYVRRQVDVALSRFSTALKAGYAGIDEMPRQGTALRFYDYDAMLDRWAAVFGHEAIFVRSYEAASASRNGILGDFLTTLGIELPAESGVFQTPMSNVSLSGDALRVLKLLNDTLAADGYSREQSAKLRRLILPVLEADTSRTRLLPSREEAERFQRQFAEANERLAEKWFDGKAVFSGDFEAFPTSPSGSDHASELLLMARAMSRLNAAISS